MKTSSRTVRVFLSSTFRDFAEERDLLVKKVFPELRRKCRERQVELIDVDLRWGITDDEAQQGKVLPICLAEIDRARPYFIGFLGERYGWVPLPNQYAPSILLKQPWLKKHRGGKSVTELEILHGVLNKSKMAGRAFFYFRDSMWAKRKGDDYLAGTKKERKRLAVLKQRIRDSGFPVVENYKSPESIAERVKADLWKLIDEAYPERQVPDALTRERITHEAYGASRMSLYLGGEQYFATIESAVRADSRHPVLVTGESGGGKSALLANWASRFALQNLNTTILSHYLAVGAYAAQPTNMVIRILREISRFTGEELTHEGDPRKVLQLLGPWLAKAGAFALGQGGMFILVIDGLDKMDAPSDLGWWPAKLPDGVALVASCLPGGIFDAVTKRMNWEMVSVSPLGRTERTRFIAEHLGEYRKPLVPAFTERILDHPLSGNPLFLRTLLEELRVFGVHEELGTKIDHYLGSLTIDDLFERVLERVESDNSPESVRAFLEILWAAKESFAEDELLAVSDLPPAVWAPIHIALDESLIGNGGRVAFSHDYLRKAVQDRYLPTEERRQRILERLAAFCAKSMEEGRKDLSHYVRRQAVAHFLEADDWDRSTAALADLEFIKARAVAQELPAMLEDYARAERLLPEGEEESKIAAERQMELNRYAHEMAEYAAVWTRIREGSKEAKPALSRPVESVRPWTAEQITTERQRITDTPNRLDLVKAFRLFVASNSVALQAYSTHQGFLPNLAQNQASGGPVHEAGKCLLEPLTTIKLVRHFAPEEVYNPLNPCRAVLEGHTRDVISLALSADGRIAVSMDRNSTIRIWNVDTGKCIKILEGHDSDITSFALSADGRVAVSGSENNTLRIWNLETSECIKALEIDECYIYGINSVALSADGRFTVSASPNNTLRIWNVETGECIQVIESSDEEYLNMGNALALGLDGRVVLSGNSDCTLRLWNVETGECIKVLKGHESYVNSVALSADGRLAVSGGNDKTLRVWNVDTGNCLKILEGHTDSVECIALSADGRLAVSGSEDKTLRVWNIESGECIKVLNGHTGSVHSLVLSADGQVAVSGSNDNTMRVWNFEFEECVKVLNGHTGSVHSLVLSADGRLAVSGGNDKTLRVWNVESGECAKVLDGHTGSVHSLVLSADGQVAVSGSNDNTMRVWNIDSGECVRVLEGHTNSILLLALRADGRVAVSGSRDKTLRVWNLESGECIMVLQTEGNWLDTINSLALSADGGLVVSGSSDKTLRVWNIESGECLRVLEGYAGCFDSVALSADGQLCVSISRNYTLSVWNVDTGKCLKILKGHTDSVNSLALSADGRIAASGSSDKTLRLWNLDTGKCLKVLKGHTGSVTSFALSADGRLAASGGSDNTLRIWNLDSGDPLAVFFLRGLAHFTIDWSRRRLALRFSDGRVEFHQIEKLSLGAFITTAQRELASEDLPAGPVTARPACCGQIIAIPPALAERIELWRPAGHKRGDSAYTDPALLFDCPSCRTPLRMNPFLMEVKPWPVD
jgi:WD40 repeat protein